MQVYGTRTNFSGISQSVVSSVDCFPLAEHDRILSGTMVVCCLGGRIGMMWDVPSSHNGPLSSLDSN